VAVKLETILDRETKISHEQFAAQIEARLGSGEGENAKGPDMKVWGKGRGINDVSSRTFISPGVTPISPQVDWLSTEFCYSPIIQSRSSADGYDLKPTAESSPEDMSHKGVFLVSLGMRYKGYCANLGRTFIVDPDKVGSHMSGISIGRQLSTGARVHL
jgi:nucleosome binding factor SPN SPT16 subunit